MTSNEEYREYIVRMVRQIQDNSRLSKIYTIVHCLLKREINERRS